MGRPYARWRGRHTWLLASGSRLASFPLPTSEDTTAAAVPKRRRRVPLPFYRPKTKSTAYITWSHPSLGGLRPRGAQGAGAAERLSD